MNASHHVAGARAHSFARTALARKCFVGTLAVLLSFSFLARAHDAGIAQTSAPPWMEYDPLLWDDLVIRGTVEKVTYSSVPAKDWYSEEFWKPDMEPLDLVYLTVRVSEALRGRVTRQEAVIIFGRDEDPRQELKFNRVVKVGVEVVATALYRADKNCNVAGVIMVSDGDAWHCVRGSLPQEPLSAHAIRTRVESVSVQGMTRESDLIVLGRITSRRDAGEPGNDYVVYEVQPLETLKGEGLERIKVRSSFDAGLNAPSLRTHISRDLAVGTKLYLFLKRTGDEYVAVAGRRSLFRIEGDAVFENVRVPSAFTPVSLKNEVERFTIEK